MRPRAKTEPGSRTGCTPATCKLMQRLIGDGFKMVGRCGAELCCERRAGAGAELLRMNAQPQAMCFALRSERPRLVNRKGVIVAESIAVSRQTFGRRLRGSTLRQPNGHTLRVVGKLGRNGVRRKQRGNNARGSLSRSTCAMTCSMRNSVSRSRP